MQNLKLTVRIIFKMFLFWLHKKVLPFCHKLSISELLCLYFETVPPRITPFSFEDNPLQDGQYVQVTCLASEGDLPIKIEWTLNGESTKQFSEITVAAMGQRSSILSIESASYAVAGNFSCTASNLAGHSSHTAELLVTGYFFSYFRYCFTLVPFIRFHFSSSTCYPVLL